MLIDSQVERAKGRTSDAFVGVSQHVWWVQVLNGRLYAVDFLNHIERNGVTVVADVSIADSVYKFRVLNIFSIADWSMETKDVKSRPQMTGPDRRSNYIAFTCSRNYRCSLSEVQRLVVSFHQKYSYIESLLYPVQRVRYTNQG